MSDNDPAFRLISRTVIVAVVVLLFIGVAIGTALSHNWYPAECCSGHDCKPVEDPREVGESGADYTYQGLRIPKAQSRPSPDDKYHACVINHGSGRRTLRCLFRPVAGS